MLHWWKTKDVHARNGGLVPIYLVAWLRNFSCDGCPRRAIKVLSHFFIVQCISLNLGHVTCPRPC